MRMFKKHSPKHLHSLSIPGVVALTLPSLSSEVPCLGDKGSRGDVMIQTLPPIILQ